MKATPLILKLWLMLFISYGGAVLGQETPSGAPVTIAPQAAAYLEEALKIMQKNSINRDKIKWPEFRKRVYDRAGAAQTTRDTYDAIRFALKELNDRHSFLIEPAVRPASGAHPVNLPLPQGEVIENRFAYVLIPTLGANSNKERILEIVRKLDAQNPCGWIVDLRHNLGGNMWPMLVGIGPILGEGLVGSFIDPEGKKNNWYYTGGQARLNDQLVLAAEGAVYRLRTPSPPVAVLLGGRTVSSGEAIAVAFMGRPNTRSFGVRTGGLSTANHPYPLSDGAQLNLTTSVFADRTGRKYGGAIEPDEVIGSVTDYRVIKAAIQWLSKQQDCAAKKKRA